MITFLEIFGPLLRIPLWIAGVIGGAIIGLIWGLAWVSGVPQHGPTSFLPGNPQPSARTEGAMRLVVELVRLALNIAWLVALLTVELSHWIAVAYQVLRGLKPKPEIRVELDDPLSCAGDSASPGGISRHTRPLRAEFPIT